MELQEHLKGSFLFHRLTGEQINAVASLARVVETSEGDVIWQRFSQDHSLLLVLEGTIETSGLAGAPTVSYGAGAVLGEASLIDGNPTSVSATVIQGGRIALIPSFDLTSLLVEDDALRAQVMQNLATLLCERLRQAGVSLFDAGEAAVRREA